MTAKICQEIVNLIRYADKQIDIEETHTAGLFFNRRRAKQRVEWKRACRKSDWKVAVQNYLVPFKTVQLVCRHPDQEAQKRQKQKMMTMMMSLVFLFYYFYSNEQTRPEFMVYSPSLSLTQTLLTTIERVAQQEEDVFEEGKYITEDEKNKKKQEAITGRLQIPFF